MPKVLCSNVSQVAQSKEVQQWCANYGVQQEFSPPYHNSSIDFVEQFNQTLLNCF